MALTSSVSIRDKGLVVIGGSCVFYDHFQGVHAREGHPHMGIGKDKSQGKLRKASSFPGFEFGLKK